MRSGGSNGTGAGAAASSNSQAPPCGQPGGGDSSGGAQRSGGAFVALRPQPPSEEVRAAWESGYAEVAGLVWLETMKLWDEGGSSAGGAAGPAGIKRDAAAAVARRLARDYLDRQLDEAVEELFAMGMEVGRVQLEGEDMTESESGGGSAAGDYSEELPAESHWWE
jgi:hypothetical protein